MLHKSATYSIELHFLQNFNNYNMHPLQNFKRHYTTQRAPTIATTIITIQLLYHWPKHLECHEHKNNRIAKYL
jgi:hypothetical protein